MAIEPAGLVTISKTAATASHRIGSTAASHWPPKNTAVIGAASAARPNIAGSPRPICRRIALR